MGHKNDEDKSSMKSYMDQLDKLIDKRKRESVNQDHRGCDDKESKRKRINKMTFLQKTNFKHFKKD